MRIIFFNEKLKFILTAHARETQVKGIQAIILDDNENQTKISGSENRTTNNRMELMAAIMALKKIKKKSEILIYTDSKYVKDGITEWIKKWKLNDWRSSNKKPVQK